MIISRLIYPNSSGQRVNYHFVHWYMLQKPSSEEECRQYLRSYKSEPVVTVTALVVTNLAANGARVSCVDVAKQHLREIPEDVIDALISKGDVLHCAGGITVEDPLLAAYLGEREGTEDSSKSNCQLRPIQFFCARFLWVPQNASPTYDFLEILPCASSPNLMAHELFQLFLCLLFSF